MLSRIFLSHEDIQTARCNKCNKYLSVPPIIIESNNSFCGRCPQKTEGTRVHFYETLAKYMIFPCSNNIYGCTVQVPWEKVLYHENNCKYEVIACPSCYKLLIKDALIEHYKLSHPNQIQKGPVEFTRLCTCQLYEWNEHIFIIQALKNSNSDDLFRISSLYEDGVKAANVKLTIKSKQSKLILKAFKIQKYCSINISVSETDKINMSIFRNTPTAELICRVDFEEKIEASKNHNYNIFSELNCSRCFGFMKPPIYVCSTGHSLCGRCRKKLLKCPTCHVRLGDTRNFSLEKIAESYNLLKSAA